jgi:hypothetical protein
MVLFKEIIYKKLTVREAEAISRKIAVEKVRKKEYLPDPELRDIEEKLQESLGTRVHIEKRETGGKLSIDFFSNDDLKTILDLLNSNKQKSTSELLDKHISSIPQAEVAKTPISDEFIDDRTPVEKKEEENEDIYSVKNFSL